MECVKYSMSQFSTRNQLTLNIMDGSTLFSEVSLHVFPVSNVISNKHTTYQQSVITIIVICYNTFLYNLVSCAGNSLAQALCLFF